jgi:hypothetical protein
MPAGLDVDFSQRVHPTTEAFSLTELCCIKLAVALSQR